LPEFCFTVTAPKASAQVSVSVGVAPECPYGYYDVAPYDCAPSGYYGPEWFTGNVFVGAGPWFHGNNEFRGKVNNSFDPQRGYKGAKPNRGEKAEPAKRVDSPTSKETKSGMDVATELAAKADPRKRCAMLRRSSAPILCFTR
jgi:hypothetical protein